MPDVESAPKPLLNHRLVSLLCISFLASFVSSPVYALLPVYVEAGLSRSPLFSAGLRALFFSLGGLFAVPAGSLCSSIGVKRVLLLGVLGPLIASAIFLSSDTILLTGLCVALGMTFGFSSTGGQSYLLGSASAAVMGTASAGYFLSSTFGTATGNLIAGPIADSLGYESLGMVGLLASVSVIFLAIVILPGIPRSEDAAPADAGQRVSYRQLLRRREVRLLLAIRYLPTSYWGAVTLLVPLLIYRLSGTNTAVTTYSAISLTCACAAQFLTGRLCDRIGRWRPVLVAASLVTVSAVGLALTASTLTGLYTFGILASVSAWSLSTTMPGILQLTAKEGEKGRVVGIAHVAWSAGMLSGNLGAGKLVEWGPGLPFGIAVVLCLGALACGVGLYRFHQGSDPSPSASA